MRVIQRTQRAFNERPFLQRFEEGMQKIAESLTKKGGVKQADKVHERIGSSNKNTRPLRYFDIEVTVQELSGTKKR